MIDLLIEKLKKAVKRTTWSELLEFLIGKTLIP